MAEKKLSGKFLGKIAFLAVIWIFVIWLIFPLLDINSINMDNAKEYLLRSVIGIGIMLIFFGKTVFDILHPLGISKKVSTLQTVWLAVYCIALAGGIIYVAVQLIALYIQNVQSSISFQ